VDDLNRQLRVALFVFLTIIPVGTIGFHFIEGWNFLDALYVSVITLATIGYGDIHPESNFGKLWAMFLAIAGLSAFAFAGQAIVQFVTSPLLRAARQKRQTQYAIDKLDHHYIICGMGEMVDRTVEYLLQSANARREYTRKLRYAPIDNFLDRIFGDDEHGHHLWLRRPLQQIAFFAIDLFHTQATILDVLVVITQDKGYAERLRDNGLLVLEGNPTDDTLLYSAGIERAQALMVLLDNDTETLLTVLTAHNLVPTLQISAAVLDDELSTKMTRVGANLIVTPYDTAGQFLNNATLRPAVADFFDGLLFEHSTNFRLTQLDLRDDSPWIGKLIGDLKLREKHDTGVIGIRYADARYGYAPSSQYVLQEDETLIVVAPAHEVELLKENCRGDAQDTYLALWQPLPYQHEPIRSETTYSLVEAEQSIAAMSKHFIICGSDRVARSAISRLNPERSFVIISHDNTLTSELLKRGFRVVHGNPSLEETLIKAGVNRAQAIMVALEKKADSILTVLNSRALNKRILITATANTDDMVDKLERAGADRVLSPFHVAARFILLTTTRPELAAFMNYVLFNYHTGLETTEIYMEDSSEWIGKTISDLKLGKRFDAGVIGIRTNDRKTFLYAPPSDYVIHENEVLIIVLPMQNADALANDAHGGAVRAPSTLRNRVLQSSKLTTDQVQEMLRQARK
jgi:voltage-gated potassium channel